jgi:hypothetical protein
VLANDCYRLSRHDVTGKPRLQSRAIELGCAASLAELISASLVGVTEDQTAAIDRRPPADPLGIFVTRASSRNRRFETALANAGLDCRDVAAKVGVDWKTAQRWLYESRVPHRKRALQVARLLGVDPAWLWPTTGAATSSADLVCVYTDIGDVPVPLWQHLADTARDCIDIATSLLPILPGEDLADRLARRAAAGVPVRLCVAPGLKPPRLDGVTVRRSGHPQLPATFRFDSAMLVWLAGAAPDAARCGPVLRLTRTEGDGLFAVYERIYDSLWSAAQPNARSATGDELAAPARGGRP